MSLKITSFALFTALVGSTAFISMAHAQSNECTPPRMMMVLDKSSSMQTGTIGGVTKWDIAVNALDDMAWEFEDQLELGLTIFPSPNQCAPGETKVVPRRGAHAEIMSELAAAPPTAGNWTPMAQSLEAVAQDPSMRSGDMPRYAVLITDGWQWCSPYDPSTRFDPASAVESLNAVGVTTYVVGFGSAVDALTLNQVAVTAGTARAGCDATGNDPSADRPCYYQADDPDELAAALALIAGEVSGVEICDGLDNDCDGLIDEDLVQRCASDCGTGSSVCTDGTWSSCDAPAPELEVCDGLDNDCDGTIDPGCECQAGESQECGSVEACQKGVQECGPDGTWGGCQGAIEPSEEMCDGVDNDCDGEVDEVLDDVMGLCELGYVCNDGSCDAMPPAEPVGEEEEPANAVLDGSPSGCGCQTGSQGSNTAALALLFGAFALLRRRNKLG